MPLLSSPAEQQRPESLRGTCRRGLLAENLEAKCSDRLIIGSVECACSLEPKIESKEGSKSSTGQKPGMMKRPGRERGRERVQIRPKPQRVAFRAQSANRASFQSSGANRIRILASIPVFVRRSFL